MLIDTISAVCTAPGEGSIGIIRLSGPKSLKIAEQIFRPQKKNVRLDQEIKKMVFGHIYDQQAKLVDEVFCVYMQAPYSYTAEDIVEIQCHGGLIILKKILALTYHYGARPAEPGEFTKRAFLNGRIDLSQAEGVMGLIKASSEIALKQALSQQQGDFSQQIKLWRQQLKNILVETQAVIDYPEEDLEEVTLEKIQHSLKDTLAEIDQLLVGAQKGRIIKEGLRTVIIGKPNVGKSSLLNALAGEEIAIVTEIAGTTRDSLQEQVFFDGIPLILIDTAGIREAQDKVEQIGIEKSKEKLKQADVVLLILDGSQSLDKEDFELFGLVKNKSHLILVNKNDMPAKFELAELAQKYAFQKEDILSISVQDRIGWLDFEQCLKRKAYGESASLGEGFYVQEARHQNLLQKASESLTEALAAAENFLPLDCILIDVENAFQNLGLIIGESISDEILQEIFARFCLGK